MSNPTANNTNHGTAPQLSVDEQRELDKLYFLSAYSLTELQAATLINLLSFVARATAEVVISQIPDALRSIEEIVGVRLLGGQGSVCCAKHKLSVAEWRIRFKGGDELVFGPTCLAYAVGMTKAEMDACRAAHRWGVGLTRHFLKYLGALNKAYGLRGEGYFEHFRASGDLAKVEAALAVLDGGESLAGKGEVKSGRNIERRVASAEGRYRAAVAFAKACIGAKLPVPPLTVRKLEIGAGHVRVANRIAAQATLAPAQPAAQAVQPATAAAPAQAVSTSASAPERSASGGGAVPQSASATATPGQGVAQPQVWEPTGSESGAVPSWLSEAGAGATESSTRSPLPPTSGLAEEYAGTPAGVLS